MPLSKRQMYGLLGAVSFCGLVVSVLVLSNSFDKKDPNARLQPTLETATADSSEGREKFESIKRIEVPATEMWLDTGIDVTGRTFRIDYDSGEWTNVTGSNFCDGRGKGPYPNLLLAHAPLASLVGKTESTSFYVGNNYRGEGQKGKLYLSLNDKPGFYNDNAGALYVIVSFVAR